jgi:small-conductance mechanosensitive channel
MDWTLIEAIAFLIVLVLILSLEFVRNIIGVILIFVSAMIIFPWFRGVIWVSLAFVATVLNSHHS